MPINFESTIREAKILSPLASFEPVIQILEHRSDPLSGRRVIVSRQRSEYVQRLIESEPSFIEELVQSSEVNCPFCPEVVEKNAPKFPPEIEVTGRIRVGEAVCFPSLFAHEDFNGIVVPTGQHRLPLSEFTSRMLLDAFKACRIYFEQVHKAFPNVGYTAIAMNFLPPAGSTIVHPHIQALASDIPLQAIADLVNAARKYAAESGSDYWRDLIVTERNLGERYLANLKGVDWLTPFAPVGLNEVDAVVCGKPRFNGLSDAEWDGLAEGMVRVLKYYHELGVRSFNVGVYASPLEDDSIPVTARIVSRYGYKPKFVSDVWALQYLLGEQEVFESPEETCIKLSTYFK
ncbi:MAG: hypothetical protein ABSD41_11525 [Candidatus Bathyarchaeia archaeon]|jgi:galactose-1-phosphate uridylyltransferase